MFTTKNSAFTLAEGRLAWQTKSALTHQASAKGGQIQDSERETIQLIKKTGLEKHNKKNGTRETECGTNSCNELIPLFPYFLIPL